MSLLRLILLIALIALVSLGLAWLADSPGSVTIDWRGYRAESSLLVLLAAFGFGIVGFLLLVWCLRKLIYLPSALLGIHSETRYERGLLALTEALAALTLSDIAQAKKQTERASKLLKNAPVIHLLSAQIAQSEGNEPATRQHLEAMLKDPHTEFAATRGLLEAARNRHNWAAAASLGERALMLRPKDRWSNLSLMDAYLHAERWEDILGLLERAQRRRAITRDEYTRYYALTHYLHGAHLSAQGQNTPAENSVQFAVKRLPAFAPACALLARLQLKRGDRNAAMKTLARGWKSAPHPELADVFLELIQPERDSGRIIDAAQKLAAAASQHIETLLLLARASMLARQNGQARSFLLSALEREKLQRIYRLLAELEKNDPEAASGWIAKAALSERDYAWTCGDCGHITLTWTIHCPACNHFDTVNWAIPTGTALTVPA